MGYVAELPVTMEGTQPMVHAAINGKDALFIADSGAFFSTLTLAGARQFNLSLDPLPFGFSVHGAGGDTQAWLTTVKTFGIFNISLRDIPFYVVSNDLGERAIGVLGQNVFRLGDVDYDLANGMIRIVRTHGDCRKTSLAYWASAKGLPYSVIDIDWASVERPHTTGTAYLNGHEIRVMFDTGAWASGLTLDAARRAGVTPESPGVRPGGNASGVGRRLTRTWIGPFASFRIGDEQILNTHLRFGATDREVDMLIGADFFLSHHVLVASSQRKLYFTYNGGPVFNLTTAESNASGPQPSATGGGESAAAAAPAQQQPAAELDAAGYARRGSALAARHEYQHGLEDLTRAIQLAPAEAGYYYERAKAYEANGQRDKALQDLSQVLTLKPDDVSALMARARLRMERGEPPETIRPDLDAADRASAREAAARLDLGELYQRMSDYAAAISQYDRWIDSHRYDDVRMPRARAARCRASALAGQQLERALADCNAAVRAASQTAGYLDSRGLVYLRQGKYDKAIADYDAAIALNPKVAWSLYGRGLARQHLGQSAAGQADIAAAEAIWPRIAAEAARDGIGP